MSDPQSKTEQVDGIRAQMKAVRRELNNDLEHVMENANSLGDVRAYVKAWPLGLVGLAAVAGYLIVPRSKSQASAKNDSGSSGTDSVSRSTQGSLIGAALGAAATAGARLAAHRLVGWGSQWFEQSSPAAGSNNGRPFAENTAHNFPANNNGNQP